MSLCLRGALRGSAHLPEHSILYLYWVCQPRFRSFTLRFHYGEMRGLRHAHDVALCR